ncbi:MAG TPA: hypothetical protein VMA09_15510 [Candidatus Binataceae bacterium]|nr:hypothetical protein [Candidatus Binataceae bacterium]
MAALALSLALAGGAAADDDSPPADLSKADRAIIELNKVLVIPQKCTETDGMMACDPNANLPEDADTPEPGSAPPSADADTSGEPAPGTPRAIDADSNGAATADRDSTSLPSLTGPEPPEPEAAGAPADISNPDVPIPDDQPNDPTTTASNDGQAIDPEYGTLEDYKQQQDMVMVPGPEGVGTLYGGTAATYYPSYPVYPMPVGGAYAAARITTNTYRPPFGPPGPWLSSPTPFGPAPHLAPAPHTFGFPHH